MTNETRTKTHELGRRSWYDDPKSEATHEVHTSDSEDGILVRLVDRGTGRTAATIMWSAHSLKTVAWTEYREGGHGIPVRGLWREVQRGAAHAALRRLRKRRSPAH